MQNTRTFARIDPRTVQISKPKTVAHTSVWARLAKKIARRTRAHLLTYILAFYILPAALSAGADAVLLTLVFPSLCFLLSARYGYRYGFITHYLAIPILLFLPASFFCFSPYTFLYSLCYLLTGCIALMIGAICRQTCK